jgi:2,3-bisphosphoglycerate-independent phosphoglycerate mutase
MVTCDHRTPVSIRSHTSDPVPFLIYDNNKSSKSGNDFNEKNAEGSNLLIEPGYRLMDFFLGRK